MKLLAAPARADIFPSKGEKKERIRVGVERVMNSPDDNPDARLQPNDITPSRDDSSSGP